MALVPVFEYGALKELCDILGEAGTGGELAGLLNDLGIEDAPEASSKPKRLLAALSARQRRDRCGNNVVAFIHATMKPVRFIGRQERFESLRASLNAALLFSGFALGEDGKLRRAVAARTLDEAQGRADRLRVELERRRVHADALRFCRPELLQENYFHAVFEATKSVADKLREKTGLTGDGSQLVEEALGTARGVPRLAFNTLRTEWERSEHTGLANLLKGMFGAFRNTTAHAPKIKWKVDEQDALDLLSLASLLHRRLDAAVDMRYVSRTAS
jgi:uncharacterized protein (TIGR02391 family)